MVITNLNVSSSTVAHTSLSGGSCVGDCWPFLKNININQQQISDIIIHPSIQEDFSQTGVCVEKLEDYRSNLVMKKECGVAVSLSDKPVSNKTPPGLVSL